MTHKSEVIKDYRYREILDHGFVGLVDSMPSIPCERDYKLIPEFGEGDAAVVQAARVSYGKGTKTVTGDRGLIRYLMRHRHTTPFEMVDFKFHCKMPIFVARQWVRHRTASINEYSARYSEMSNEFYIPNKENIKPQSSSNKQGGEGSLSVEDAKSVQEWIENNCHQSMLDYWVLLGKEENGGSLSPDFKGISRELARIVLPLNNYTTWYWKINLHNLLHFIGLRSDPHAQWEIQQYSNAMKELITPLVPAVIEAFNEYKVEGTTISKREKEIITCALRVYANGGLGEANLDWLEKRGIKGREAQEFMEKFNLT